MILRVVCSRFKYSTIKWYPSLGYNFVFTWSRPPPVTRMFWARKVMSALSKTISPPVRNERGRRENCNLDRKIRLISREKFALYREKNSLHIARKNHFISREKFASDSEFYLQAISETRHVAKGLVHLGLGNYRHFSKSPLFKIWNYYISYY